MPNTHCLTAGTLGTAEIPVANVGAPNITTQTPVGAKRGVVVFLHGMGVVAETVPLAPSGALLTFQQGLAADGWVVLDVTYPEGLVGALATTAMFNDVNADAGHGARHKATKLHWWDHIYNYVLATYGAWPVVPFGLSWGGWHAYTVAAARTSNVIAYGAHEAVTVLSAVSATFTAPTNFTTLDTSGLDLASSSLNAITGPPGIIGWGTADTVVGSANLIALYNAAHAAGANVTSNATAETHGWAAADTTAYQTWFTNVVDPLAPAVH